MCQRKEVDIPSTHVGPPRMTGLDSHYTLLGLSWGLGTATAPLPDDILVTAQSRGYAVHMTYFKF